MADLKTYNGIRGYNIKSFNGVVVKRVKKITKSFIKYVRWFWEYVDRVDADSGDVQVDDTTLSIYRHLEINDTYDNTKLLFTPEAGIKIRESGVYDFITKGYDLSDEDNDLTQTTEADQPYISGNIAPNEKLVVKNPNGDTRYLEYTEISFASNEPWTLTCVFNWDGNHSEILFSGGSNTQLEIDVEGKLKFTNESGASDTTADSIYEYAGKYAILHLITDGDGSIEVRINDTLFDTLSVANDADFGSLFDPVSTLVGRLAVKIIYSGEKSSLQITTEYTFLRSIYPEIESVVIGDQEWATSNCEMVATPEGNVIANVTLAANTDRVENGTFDADTDWSKGDGWSIGAGVASCDGTQAAASDLGQAGILTSGKWYKVTFDISGYVDGNVKPVCGTADYQNENANGSYTHYIKANGTGFAMQGDADFEGDIDNVVAEEVGWSGLGDLYDDLVNNQSYTAYNAYKEVAAWCYFNNDSEIGAVYGKLYNWYAVKLLDLDMASSGFGWRVPTQAQSEALAIALGGASVAGGKMKVPGTDYWNSPNTGATNESGFSVVGSGYRAVAGGFSSIKDLGVFWGLLSGYRIVLKDDEESVALGTVNENAGFNLRLIKE